jgi:hypothetical protein
MGRMTQITTKSHDIDPVISETVAHISNRFGSQGLCDLIALAREELGRAEEAMHELTDAQ